MATKLSSRQCARRSALVGAAIAMAAAGISGVGAASAAGNTFSSQWADLAASGTSGLMTWNVTVAVGKDNHDGKITEHLKTRITGNWCEGGHIYEAELGKTEQATDLMGVDIQALNGAASISRRTALPGILTKTASGDCVSKTGDPVTETLLQVLTLQGTWVKWGGAVTYNGKDCGGIGSCTYYDAKVTMSGPVKVKDKTMDIVGATSTKPWLWNGAYPLTAP